MSLENYTSLTKVGEDTYASVYEAIDSRTSEKVIIEQFQNIEEAQNQVTVLQSLNHPNIISIRDVFDARSAKYIVTNYNNITLNRYIRMNQDGLSPNLIQSYAYQILCAIAYMHDRGIVHRDISAQSCWINNSGLLQLANFYFAHTGNACHTPSLVRLWYRPPEILLGAPEYGCLVDLFSAGCVIAEMVTRKPLIRGESEAQQLLHTFELLGTPTAITYPDIVNLPGYSADFPIHERKDLATVLGTDNAELVDLIGKLLEIDPARRITAREALRHPYFDGLSSSIVDLCFPPEISE